jgi:hypothetical protein
LPAICYVQGNDDENDLDELLTLFNSLLTAFLRSSLSGSLLVIATDP